MKKVLIIGDSCIDEFVYGTCERICPEAPVPILIPTTTITNGGMSLNVESNLKALGVEYDIFTNIIKPIKRRFIDELSNHMFLRVDLNDEVTPIINDDLLAIDFSKYEVVIISDYNKGFLPPIVIEYITTKHDFVFLDTKKKLSRWCCGVKVLKINDKEYTENSEFLNKYFHNQLIITKGKFGVTLNKSEVFPIESKVHVRDLSGAGDTFLAALVANFINTKDIREAIKFANKCASWVVTQRGVVAVDLEKVKERNGKNDNRNNW